MECSAGPDTVRATWLVAAQPLKTARLRSPGSLASTNFIASKTSRLRVEGLAVATSPRVIGGLGPEGPGLQVLGPGSQTPTFSMLVKVRTHAGLSSRVGRVWSCTVPATWLVASSDFLRSN